jgi:hypothetical protein
MAWTAFPRTPNSPGQPKNAVSETIIGNRSGSWQRGFRRSDSDALPNPGERDSRKTIERSLRSKTPKSLSAFGAARTAPPEFNDRPARHNRSSPAHHNNWSGNSPAQCRTF